MKNLKSVLAVLAALCLLLCLTVPVFATGDLTTTGTAPAESATTDSTAPDATGTEDDGLNGAQPDADVEDGDIKLPVDPDAVESAGEDDTQPATEPVVQDTHDHVAEEAAKPSVLRVILIVLEVIASIALIIMILVQSGKESGLSGALSGNSDSYMSKGNRATLDKKLATMTKWVALVWVALTLLLSLV